MKLIVVLCAIVAVALARPGYLAGGVASIAAAPSVVAAASPAATAVIADADPTAVVAAAPEQVVVSAAPATTVIAAAPAPVAIAAVAPVAYTAAVPASAVIAAAAPVASTAALPAPSVIAAAVPVAYTSAAAAPAVIAAAAPVISAAPAVIAAAAPVTYTASVVAPLTITSQYHAQDELGQYAYGYAGGPSAKEEVHTADGITRGGYSHVDADGLIQTTSYVSDPVNGFRVAATNLPVAPKAEDAVALGAPQQVGEEPVVAATRAAHEALKAELAAAAEATPDNVEVEPLQVEETAPIVLTAAGVPVDTPEIIAARAAEAIAHIEAKQAAILGQ